MSKASDAMEIALLELILNNVNFANIGDATGLRGSVTAGNLYASLHVGAGLVDASNQATNEIAYGAYARVALVRNGSLWTVAGGGTGVASNAAIIAFPTCTSGSATATSFGIGTASSGAGILLLHGTCSLAISSGITPSFGIGTLTITCA